MLSFKEYLSEEHGAGEWGTPELVKKYKHDTPGESCGCSECKKKKDKVE